MRFAHRHPRFRGMIAGEIRRRGGRPGSEGTDLFGALAAARYDTGHPLDDEEIANHVFTLLVAGVDPAAIALTWALYWIRESPEAKATLLRELSSLGDAPDPRQVARLPYLSATCQEALWMYPVVATPTGRKLTAPAKIQGRPFAAGTTLVPCTYLVHHREELGRAARVRTSRTTSACGE